MYDDNIDNKRNKKNDFASAFSATSDRGGGYAYVGYVALIVSAVVAKEIIDLVSMRRVICEIDI